MTADAVGGVWTYAIDLARGLGERGVDVVLATMGPRPDDSQRDEAARVPRLALVESEHRLEWMEEPWDDVRRAGEWLLALEDEHRPDVVHLNGYAHAALPWRAPCLVVAHSCVAGWWEAVHGTPLPPSWDRYAQEVARGLRAASLVVAPTRAMLESLARHYGPLERPARVIPNGRHAAAFAPGTKEPLVLAVGRAWDPAKGIATLDAAAEGASWPLHVLGAATSPDGGRAAPLRHARAEGRVPPEALRRWYARASVFAHAARYEPFGLGPLEAALSGCALVLSDIPTLREVWADAALYAPPGDAAAFRDQLRRLASDPALLARMQQAARARASRYTLDAMAERYVAAYAALLDPSELSDSLEVFHCAS